MIKVYLQGLLYIWVVLKKKTEIFHRVFLHLTRKVKFLIFLYEGEENVYCITRVLFDRTYRTKCIFKILKCICCALCTIPIISEDELRRERHCPHQQ